MHLARSSRGCASEPFCEDKPEPDSRCKATCRSQCVFRAVWCHIALPRGLPVCDAVQVLKRLRRRAGGHGPPDCQSRRHYTSAVPNRSWRVRMERLCSWCVVLDDDHPVLLSSGDADGQRRGLMWTLVLSPSEYGTPGHRSPTSPSGSRLCARSCSG